MTDPVTSMVFVDQLSKKVLWRTPPTGPWQPIPRVDEHVRYGRGPQVYRVVQVLHVWFEGMSASRESRCYEIEVTVSPAYEEDSGGQPS